MKPKEKEEEMHPLPPAATEFVRIGELIVGSAYVLPEGLWQLARKILKNPDVKMYLEFLRKKQKIFPGSSVG